MNHKVSFCAGEYYHLYNRGVEKRTIFQDDNDYRRFMKSLYVFNSSREIIFKEIERKTYSEIDREETLVDIGAHILMKNHFHLLIRAKTDQGISSFMQKLLTSYTMYFNKKYDRVGSLFGSTFHSRHTDSDEYLKYLYAYIHLNILPKDEPDVKNNTDFFDILKKYPYSSYLDYQDGDQREESLIINKTAFPDYFETPADMDELLEDAYQYKLFYG